MTVFVVFSISNAEQLLVIMTLFSVITSDNGILNVVLSVKWRDIILLCPMSIMILTILLWYDIDINCSIYCDSVMTVTIIIDILIFY